jgi:hypothetical protein
VHLFFFCHNGKTYFPIFSIFSINIQKNKKKNKKNKKGHGREKREEKEDKVGKLNNPPPKEGKRVIRERKSEGGEER